MAEQKESSVLFSLKELMNLEENRIKEEAARLDAIKHGEIEKARSEAEHRSRMEAMAQAQAHEQQLVALQSHSGNKRLKVIVGIVSGVLVIAGIGGTMAFMSSQEQAAKEKQLAAQELQRRDEELKKLKADDAAEKQKMEELSSALGSAKDDATRAQLEAQLAKQKEKVQKAGAALRGGGGGGKPAGGGAPKPCNCPPGDPLCSCL